MACGKKFLYLILSSKPRLKRLNSFKRLKKSYGEVRRWGEDPIFGELIHAAEKDFLDRQNK